MKKTITTLALAGMALACSNPKDELTEALSQEATDSILGDYKLAVIKGFDDIDRYRAIVKTFSGDEIRGTVDAPNYIINDTVGVKKCHPAEVGYCIFSVKQ